MANSNDGRICYTVSELAELWGVSKRKVQEMMKSGELRYYSVGKAKRVSKEMLEEYIKKSEEKNLPNHRTNKK